MKIKCNRSIEYVRDIPNNYTLIDVDTDVSELNSIYDQDFGCYFAMNRYKHIYHDAENKSDIWYDYNTSRIIEESHNGTYLIGNANDHMDASAAYRSGALRRIKQLQNRYQYLYIRNQLLVNVCNEGYTFPQLCAELRQYHDGTTIHLLPEGRHDRKLKSIDNATISQNKIRMM